MAFTENLKAHSSWNNDGGIRGGGWSHPQLLGRTARLQSVMKIKGCRDNPTRRITVVLIGMSAAKWVTGF